MTALIAVATVFLIGLGFLFGVMWLGWMIHNRKLTVEVKRHLDLLREGL